MKTKILVVCNKGKIRSKYLAGYIRKKGYMTKFGGVSKNAKIKVTKNKLKWADKILVVDKIVKKKLISRHKVPKKEIITIDVSDSSKDYSKQARKIMEDARKKFREKYVYPNLRKQINKELK